MTHLLHYQSVVAFATVGEEGEGGGSRSNGPFLQQHAPSPAFPLPSLAPGNHNSGAPSSPRPALCCNYLVTSFQEMRGKQDF